jgi:hypothetical protein
VCGAGAGVPAPAHPPPPHHCDQSAWQREMKVMRRMMHYPCMAVGFPGRRDAGLLGRNELQSNTFIHLQCCCCPQWTREH